MRIISRQAGSERGDALVWVLIIVVLLAAAGVGYWTIWHRHHTKPVVAVSASCGPNDLSLSKGASDGTAGTIYKHAVVTNTSTHSCTLAGYPAAFLADSHDAVLGSGAASNSLYSVVALTLAAGGKAHTVLGFPEAGNFSDPSACSVPSVSLQLYVPGAILPLSTAWSDQSCPGFSVTAFQPGA